MVGIIVTSESSWNIKCFIGCDEGLSGLIRNLFSVSCEGEGDEEYYSEWTNCFWPNGDLRPLVVNFTKDALNKGCKVEIKLRSLVK